MFIILVSFRFDQSRLKDAHEASQSLMKTSCEDGKRLIIVDNTNVQTWEMKSYFNHANKAPYTYKVIVVEPKTPWKFDAGKVIIYKSRGDLCLLKLRYCEKTNRFKKKNPTFLMFTQ